jgi:hypothetical protein
MKNYAAFHYYIALQLSILGYNNHPIIIIYRPSPVPFIQSELRYIYTETKPGRMLSSCPYKSSLSARAIAIPIIAPLRHGTAVSLDAEAFELLVPTIFPSKPQLAPEHGAYVGATVVVGVEVTKNPCSS